MIKWVLYIIFGLGIAAGWHFFMSSGHHEEVALQQEISRIEESGTLNEQERVPALQEQIRNMKSGKTLTGVMLAFLTAGLVGVIFVVDVLPILAHKLTHAVYDSGEKAEQDDMHRGRSLYAQGDLEGAIKAYHLAAAANPLDRMPWVEVAKIQRENLHDPDAAIQTLRSAIQGQEWQENDAAFLMFRLAEIYAEDREDTESARSILQQVIDSFPETRHAANARYKLHEWGFA